MAAQLFSHEMWGMRDPIKRTRIASRKSSVDTRRPVATNVTTTPTLLADETARVIQ